VEVAAYCRGACSILVPGPTIHVNLGDKVWVILHNQLPESTVIHFHGLIVPNAMDGVPDITQLAVKAGQGLHRRVHRAGTGGGDVPLPPRFRQAGHQRDPGASLVGEEPLPNGVQPSQEFPFVLNDAGVIGLSINGKSFPATAPIVANNGDWILVHYFNKGFQIHPMHLHGLPGMVVAKDGFAFPALHGGHRAGGTGGALQRADPRRPLGTWASPKSRRNQALRP